MVVTISKIIQILYYRIQNILLQYNWCFLYCFCDSDIPGIIQNSIKYLWEEVRKKDDIKFRFRASYLEIYNEQVDFMVSLIDINCCRQIAEKTSHFYNMYYNSTAFPPHSNTIHNLPFSFSFFCFLFLFLFFVCMRAFVCVLSIIFFLCSPK